MTERLLLYHGTDRQRVGDIARTGNLYGYRCPANPNYSGTLTDSLAIAGVSAQKKVDFGRHRPAILHFQIPTDKLICEGPIGNNETLNAYSTIFEVDPHDLPPEYLNVIGFTIEEASACVASGEMAFFRVPTEYLVYVEFG